MPQEAGGFDCAGLGDANKVETVKYKLTTLNDLIDVLTSVITDREQESM